MRSIVAKIVLFLVVGVAAAGCQSPGNMVGALQPVPYGSGILNEPAGTMPPSTPMPASLQAADTPDGFISFCLRFHNQCTTPADKVSQATVTPITWQILNRINDRVNADIAPESDLEHYGRPEYWTIPTDGYGDCDDYALTKRKALIAAGFPELALRVAVVITPDGSRHAVLTVATNKGDYVLDNMRAAILPWTATGYRWIERQAANNPLSWVSLQSDGITRPIAVAANTVADNSAADTPMLRHDLDAVASTALHAQPHLGIPGSLSLDMPRIDLAP